MFDNLKKQDWIAAALRGLSAGATIYFTQGMGGPGDGKKDTPTPGTQDANSPIGDMDFLPDGAFPILDWAGIDIEDMDFMASVLRNVQAGPNALAQVNTPMNYSRMKFDPTAALFDITPELDLDAIIPGAIGGVVGDAVDGGPIVGGLAQDLIPPNAYQVGDTIP